MYAFACYDEYYFISNMEKHLCMYCDNIGCCFAYIVL